MEEALTISAGVYYRLSRLLSRLPKCYISGQTPPACGKEALRYTLGKLREYFASFEDTQPDIMQSLGAFTNELADAGLRQKLADSEEEVARLKQRVSELELGEAIGMPHKTTCYSENSNKQ